MGKKEAAPKDGGNKNMMKKEGKGDAVQKKGPDKQNIVVKVDEADVDDGWGSEDPFYHLQRQRRFKHDLPKAEGADDQGQSPDKNKINIYMKKKAEGTGDETGEGNNQRRENVTDADREKAALQIQNACKMDGKKIQKEAKDPNKDKSEQTGKSAEAVQNMHGKKKQKAKDPNKDQSEQTGKSAEAVQNMHGKEKQKKAKDPNKDQSEQTGKSAEAVQN